MISIRNRANKARRRQASPTRQACKTMEREVKIVIIFQQRFVFNIEIKRSVKLFQKIGPIIRSSNDSKCTRGLATALCGLSCVHTKKSQGHAGHHFSIIEHLFGYWFRPSSGIFLFFIVVRNPCKMNIVPNTSSFPQCRVVVLVSSLFFG